MSPIYFIQKGAQIVLKSDSIKVIVCRRLQNFKGESILTYPGRTSVRSAWHSESEVLLSKGRYYFIYTCVSSLPSDIDAFISNAVQEATIAMERI